jgi:hypothetical protein
MVAYFEQLLINMKTRKIHILIICLFVLVNSGCKKEKDNTPSDSASVDYRDALEGKYIGLRHKWTAGAPPHYDSTYIDSVVVTKVAADSIYFGSTEIKLEPGTLSGGYSNNGHSDLYVKFRNDSVYSYYSGGGLGQSQYDNFSGKKTL